MDVPASNTRSEVETSGKYHGEVETRASNSHVPDPIVIVPSEEPDALNASTVTLYPFALKSPEKK